MVKCPSRWIFSSFCLCPLTLLRTLLLRILVDGHVVYIFRRIVLGNAFCLLFNNHIPALVKNPHLNVFYGNSLGSFLNFYVFSSEKVAASDCCVPPLRRWQRLLGCSAHKYVHACTQQECIHYVPRSCGREATHSPGGFSLSSPNQTL